MNMDINEDNGNSEKCNRPPTTKGTNLNKYPSNKSWPWSRYCTLSHHILYVIPISFIYRYVIYVQQIDPIEKWLNEQYCFIIMTKKTTNQLRVMQRAMERTILNISLRGRIENKETQQRFEVVDIIARDGCRTEVTVCGTCLTTRSVTMDLLVDTLVTENCMKIAETSRDI